VLGTVHLARCVLKEDVRDVGVLRCLVHLVMMPTVLHGRVIHLMATCMWSELPG
jgi:hypothetical protein